MADYVSRRSTLSSNRRTNAGEFVAWDVAGVFTASISSYVSDIILGGNGTDKTSKVTTSIEVGRSTATEIPTWDVSGIPTPMSSSYATTDFISMCLDASKSRLSTSAQSGMSQVGDIPSWFPSGIPTPMSSSYNDIDNVFANISNKSSKAKTPDPSLPLVAVSTASVTTYYLRARDASLALTNPLRYVYWKSIAATLASYTGVLPGVGPLTDLIILTKIIT